MSTDLKLAKFKLDTVLNKARMDFYKPIQIAEVLYHSRIERNINITNKEDYRTQSKKWRDEVSLKLLGKYCKSSSKYQDDVWSETAMPHYILSILDKYNQQSCGVVEKYIYSKLQNKQGIIATIIDYIQTSMSAPQKFYLEYILESFRESKSGMKRSIDKCYEIISYSIFESVLQILEAEIIVKVPKKNYDILEYFGDLAKVLLGVNLEEPEWREIAHIYRVGVTNAADRGLDMWTNFGPAIQVKHLTLDATKAEEVVDQIESDNILIICKDAEASVISIIMRQINWGKRVRGIVTESQLIEWYNRCLRGSYREKIAPKLLEILLNSFKREFPGAESIADFLLERGYSNLKLSPMWKL